jgi:ATP-dependent DNA helicase RecG
MPRVPGEPPASTGRQSLLTDVELRRLIAAGEQFTTEFIAESSGALADDDLVEAIVCLANGHGGVVLVGIEDDGRVTGARHRHGTYTDPRRLTLMIAGRTVPSCPVECGVISVDGLDVLAVEIPSGRPVTSTSGGVYRRRGTDAHGRPMCVPFLVHEIQSREATRGALDYTALIVPDARWEDLDPLEIERVRRTVALNRGRADASLLDLSDAEIVRALGLGEGGGPTGDRVDRVRVAALLMVGREEAIKRYVPNHEVAFQVMRGTRVAVNEFIRWPLVRTAEEVGLRFDARNQEDEVAVGMVRVGVPAHSPLGFREALHNALVHRDYTRAGAVHVQIREGDGGGEIEVSNPGGFPDQVRLDNILVAPPRPRNPVLADAFKRIGLVERTGRGIDTIFEGQLRYGRQVPDYSRSTVATVQVILNDGPANIPITRMVVERDVPGRRLSLDELLLLNTVAHEQEPIGLGRASMLIQRLEGPTRAVLDRLMESGLLDGWDDRRERVYYFTSPVARALGVQDLDEDVAAENAGERERKILEYVDLHGKITRSAVAELFSLEGREARTVLEKLVRRGDLVVRGEKRGAYYERAGAGSRIGLESEVQSE